MEKFKNSKVNSYILMASCMILICFITILGSSFATFTKNATSSLDSIKSGTVSVFLTEPGDAVSLSSSKGTDALNMAGTDNYVEFQVGATSTGKISVQYYLYFTEESGNDASSSDVKLYLTEVNNNVETAVTSLKTASAYDKFNTTTLTTDSSSSNYLLDSDIFNFTSSSTQTKTYRIRMWIGSGSDGEITYSGTSSDDREHTAEIVSSGTYAIKLHVIGKQSV